MSSQEDILQDSPAKRKNPIGWIIMLVVMLAGGFYGVRMYRLSEIQEVTDNAQIDGNIVPVSARARGQVAEVKVGDNDVVKKGDLLFTLDSSDYQNKLDQAQSALASAKNHLAQARLQVALADRTTSAQVGEKLSSIAVSEQQVLSAGKGVAVAQAQAAQTESGVAQALAKIAQAQAEVKSAQAQQKTAEAEAKRLRDDRERYRELFSKREVSAQQFEAASTAAAQAESQVEAARQQVAAVSATVDSAQAQLANAQAARQVAVEGIGRAEAARGEMEAKVGEARGRLQEAEAGTLQTSVARSAVDGYLAEVQRAESQLKQARLDLSYTKITAPSSGRVTRKNIEPGQYVEVGLPVMVIVDETNLWVVANFKETQMEKIAVGLEATLEIDTYPGTPLKGKIASIQSGTGSVFSLLPPENASGSFVKVVQRIPVKIAIEASEQKKVPLRPGMSVEATVWLQ